MKAVAETMTRTKCILPRKEWITPEIIGMIEDRRKYENSNKAEHQQKYRTLKNLITRKSKETKEKYIEIKCKEIDSLIKTGWLEVTNKTVKNVFRTCNPKYGAIENKQGTCRWKMEGILRGTVWQGITDGFRNGRDEWKWTEWRVPGIKVRIWQSSQRPKIKESCENRRDLSGTIERRGRKHAEQTI